MGGNFWAGFGNNFCGSIFRQFSIEYSLNDWLILSQTIVWWCFVVKLGSRLSCKFVFIAGFQPESKRQCNETNLALLKPYTSPLREVKAAGNFWPRRLLPFESYWKVDLLKKEMEPGNSSSVKTDWLPHFGKKPFEAMMKISESIIVFTYQNAGKTNHDLLEILNFIAHIRQHSETTLRRRGG